MLGNMLEASILTPNPLLYGDLHNQMHMSIAFSHDPDQRHLESFGVIGDPSTGMRDPLFYRLHTTINDIFVEFKNTQPRYTTAQVCSTVVIHTYQRFNSFFFLQLDYPGVRVTGVELVTPNADRNTLQTFWQKSNVDLSRGMDFAPRGAIFARYTHLQHAPFLYRINVCINQYKNLDPCDVLQCKITYMVKLTEVNYNYR
jgi:tyrosinase